MALREAVAYVNGAIPGAQDRTAWIDETVDPLGTNDIINFASGLNGKTITLTQGELTINEAVTIDASSLSGNLTIDAGGGTDGVVGNADGSRVFNIELNVSGDDAVTLAGLTITGGDISDLEGGGGVLFRGHSNAANASVTLTIVDSVIRDNYAKSGGGVSTFISAETSGIATLAIVDSVISGNQVQFSGGGVGHYASSDYFSPGVVTLDITGSTIQDNVASSSFRGGGGIYANLGGDFTTDDPAGSVFTLTDSTVANNSAINGDGGGLWVCPKSAGTFNATHSTISGNSAVNQGGGLWIAVSHGDNMITNLNHVTITNNSSPTGGGLFSKNDSGVKTTLSHTIVSGNDDGNGVANNIAGQIEAVSSYNLIGQGQIVPANLTGAGNIFDSDNNPDLAPLVNNGGPTKTHMPTINAIDPTQDAIDAGDPSFGSTPQFDQRGAPYTRVADGDGAPRIDIGAVEYGVGTPRVTDVISEGSDLEWDRAPFRFSSLVEAGEQLRPIFTEGIDTIKIQFSEDVSFGSSGSELTLDHSIHISTGGATNTTLDNTKFTFEYRPEILTGIWTFDQPTSTPLLSGKYAIKLVTSSILGGGEALDGEWDNDDNGDQDGNGINNDDNRPDDYTDDVGRAFLSGDGLAGSTDSDHDGEGEFRFHFAILHGDYDQNGEVNADDAEMSVIGDGDGDGNIENGPTDDDTLIALNNNENILPLRAIYGADLNYDEIVDYADLMIWQNGFGGFGGSGIAGDVDGDGDADGADFLWYQRAYNSRSAWFEGSINVGVGGSIPLVLEGLAPQITGLVISGSSSLHDPFSFDTVDGSGTQLQTVPVGGADTISITFSELVNISADSLRLIGLTTANVPQLAEFSYDVMTMTATWRFESWALGDQYLISLPDSVTDVEGNLLDGEWTNPASINTVNSLVSTFPSGDGTAGGHFNFVATLLPGDIDLNGEIDEDDMAAWLEVSGSAPSPSTWIFGDFNGDGVSDSADWQILEDNFDLYGTFPAQVQILADLDGDFLVDVSDLSTINANIGMTGATYTDGDLNGDGVVDIADVDLAFAQFGLGLSLVS